MILSQENFPGRIYQPHLDQMNKSHHIFYHIFLSFAILLLAIGCSSDEGVRFPSDLTTLSINMGIEGSVSTRFERTTIDDKWSIDDFTKGDEMGLYASGGNWLNGDQNTPFNNEELVYDGESQFNSPLGMTAFSPSGMKGNEVYMYFPYCQEMNTTGLELRQMVTSDRSIRCIDFLSANNLTMEGNQGGNQTALYGSFQHSFSELIIMRGEGFDDPPESTENTDYSRITAVINTGVTHIKVNFSMENGWSCTPELVYNENANFVTTVSEAKEWDAWKGGNYGITQLDPDGKEAWYVIVPTLRANRSIVEYIELYNNDGQLLRVTSLKLSGGNTKYVDPGWRYPLEITMNELVPTVNPFPIMPWGETVDLTDERTRGINNIAEFTKWITDYDAYLENSSDPDNIQALLAYGDMTTDGDTEEVTWEFYLLSDLDFTNYTLTDGELENNVIIPDLINASLNGQRAALSGGNFLNYKITGLKNTFIGGMENASLMNIDFVSPSVSYDENNTSTVGIIVNSMKNSELTNCNISKGTLFNPGGSGGMLAGKINGGSITKCSVSGFLTVSSYAENGIVGETPTGDADIQNNNTDIVN